MHTPKEYREMEFIELFISLAKLFKPKVYVELGVKKGYTIKRMAEFVEKAIGVDINIPAIDLPNVELVQCKTVEFAKSFNGRDPFIDMLFIDADHEKEAVLWDFLSYLPYVRPGTGLILLHDTHPVNDELIQPGYCHNAWQAAEFIYKDYHTDVEIVTLPGPWAGLSIARRLGPHHLAWKQEGR